ncbi:MAG: sugar phosphate isomerase/epimerase [Planctomycetota bacterium]|nr:sugar phosphate isomerase/epimerase [Planctomycetota bacterium]
MRIGVCSWSLQVGSITELKGLIEHLGISSVQIACGDPHHASWIEGDAMPQAALAASLEMTGAMLGFPGEDYNTPASIEATGGFGDPSTRPERFARLAWALGITCQLGLTDLMMHGGFIPGPGASGRRSMLDTLAKAADMARERGIILALETGQESAQLLRQTLDDLRCPNLKVNFDPANMLLYNMGDPIEAVEILAGDIHSVHLKDAFPPRVQGEWGEEVPLGEGRVNIPLFIKTLKKIDFEGPLCIEREVGDQGSRVRDIARGFRLVNACLSS